MSLSNFTSLCLNEMCEVNRYKRFQLLDGIEPFPCGASSQPKCPRGESFPREKINSKKQTVRDAFTPSAAMQVLCIVLAPLSLKENTLTVKD